MVFYRKYRPQTIEELDSDEARKALTAALAKTPPHAFIFTGPKGLGKTSAARIVAKFVNCLSSGQSAKKEIKIPCNKCDQCLSITHGTNMDVLEIDGASNRGIDEMRDLREKIRLMPVSAKRKVYIIDEVHMLTTEAFNALLKTLEEPPPHAMFILCTTEPHKVPPTIMSRCFHISFKKATEEELTRSFKRIAKGENIGIDDHSLKLIASVSDNSFRDGAKILEEIAAFAKGKKITPEMVESIYHSSSIKQQISIFMEALIRKDTKKALGVISETVGLGIEIKYFLEQLLLELHRLLLIKTGVSAGETQDFLEEIKVEEVNELIRLLVRANEDLRFSPLPQLPLEIVAIEWTLKNKEVALGTGQISEDKVSEGKKVSVQAGKDEPDLWKNFIEKIKPYNHSVAGVLRGCSLQDFKDGKMLIQTPYKFHKEKLEEPKTRLLLEKIGKELTGKEIRVAIKLK